MASLLFIHRSEASRPLWAVLSVDSLYIPIIYTPVKTCRTLPPASCPCSSHGCPVQRNGLRFQTPKTPKSRHARACHTAVRFAFRHSAGESSSHSHSPHCRHGRTCSGHPRLFFFPWATKKFVDARAKPAHDDSLEFSSNGSATHFAEPDSRVLVTGIHEFFAAEEHVDPRDKPGGDDNGESARSRRLSAAVGETRTGQPCEKHGHDDFGR